MEETPKRKRGRPPNSKDKKPRKRKTTTNETDYNARQIDFGIEIAAQTRADKNDVPEMRRRFENYLVKCKEYGIQVGNISAYTAIGISRGEAYQFERQTTNPELSDFIRYVRSFCAVQRELLMLNNKVNPATGIFWQKNYDGLKDQQEHVMTVGQPLGSSVSDEVLERKYLSNAQIAELPDAEQPAVIDTTIHEEEKEKA